MREKLIAVGIDLHFVVFKGQGHTLVFKERHQRTIGVGNAQIALLGKLQHGSFGQLVKRPLADHSFLARVLSKEEIEDDAKQRDEPKH